MNKSEYEEKCEQIFVVLTEGGEVVSFDVLSLYTNVPVMEVIEICTEHLYRHEQKHPPIDRNTFIILAKIASCDVLMSTHDGYYKQVVGLAMGSPPAPHLANSWMSKFGNTIKGEAVLYARYMDAIIWNIKRIDIEEKLATINNLHPSLKFTIKREENGSIPFLDMKIIHNNWTIVINLVQQTHGYWPHDELLCSRSKEVQAFSGIGICVQNLLHLQFMAALS